MDRVGRNFENSLIWNSNNRLFCLIIIAFHSVYFPHRNSEWYWIANRWSIECEIYIVPVDICSQIAFHIEEINALQRMDAVWNVSKYSITLKMYIEWYIFLKNQLKFRRSLYLSGTSNTIYTIFSEWVCVCICE